MFRTASLALFLLVPAAGAAGSESGGAPDRMRAPDDLAAFAAGFVAPFSGSPQKAVPLVYCLGYSGREGRTPLCWLAELETTSLLVRLSAQIGSGFFSTIDFSGTYGSRDAASYFTDEDGFDPDRSFYQSAAGVRGAIGTVFGAFGLARVFAAVEGMACSKLRGSSPYSPPPDHTQVSAGFRAEWKDVSFLRSWTLKEGFSAVFEAAYCRRDHRAAWGFDEAVLTAPGRFAEWGRVKCALGAYFSDGEDKNLLIDLRLGFAEDADRSSAPRAGSAVGDPPLAGTPYGRAAMDRFAFLRAEFSFGLWAGARISVGADAGIFRDLDRRVRGAAGFFLGLTQKTIMGLPVSVVYGYCPVAGDGAESMEGHEIMIVARCAFY